MVTHRVQVMDPKDINADVIAWMCRAYEKVVWSAQTRQ